MTLVFYGIIKILSNDTIKICKNELFFVAFTLFITLPIFTESSHKSKFKICYCRYWLLWQCYYVLCSQCLGKFTIYVIDLWKKVRIAPVIFVVIFCVDCRERKRASGLFWMMRSAGFCVFGIVDHYYNILCSTGSNSLQLANIT